MLFKTKKVCCGKRVLKKAARLNAGDIIRIELSDEQEHGVLPQSPAIPLQIIYEDESLLALNKAEQMHTVATLYCDTDTLMNAVAAHLGGPIREGGVLNGGSINRLDYETLGIVLVAKTAAAFYALYETYRMDETEKYYLAWVSASVPASGSMEDALIKTKINETPAMRVGKEGRFAKADFVPLYNGKAHTLLLLRLYSGLRHQLRVQLAARSVPIGDTLYGGRAAPRLMLHTLSVCIRHPRSQKRMLLSARPPASFLL